MATTTTTKAKAAPKASESNVTPFPAEMPEAVREIAEKGIDQAKETYAKMKTMAEETTDMLEDTFTTASKGLTEFQHKAIDAARENANAGFDFIKDMMTVKSVSEAVELQTAFARKQYEALMGQSKELGEMASKVAQDSAKPLNEGVQKAVKSVSIAS